MVDLSLFFITRNHFKSEILSMESQSTLKAFAAHTSLLVSMKRLLMNYIK